MDNRKIKTNEVIEFLFKAEINWVIINPDGTPLRWEDGNVKVYSCIEDLMADYDRMSGQSIMTEFAFVQRSLDDFWNYNDYLAGKFTEE